MDHKNITAQQRYLDEVAVNLHRIGFQTGNIENGNLPVNLNGVLFCRVSGKGTVLYSQEIAEDSVQVALDRVVGIADSTREYMAMMEYAPPLQVQGLTGDYRILADFNTSVLVGHPTDHGVQFVIWDWDFDRKGVHHGGYYQEWYEGAKRDFAILSGLVDSRAFFAPEQIMEIYRALAFVREQDDTLTLGRDREVQELMTQIRLLQPSVVEEMQETKLEQTME